MNEKLPKKRKKGEDGGKLSDMTEGESTQNKKLCVFTGKKAPKSGRKFLFLIYKQAEKC